MRPLSPAALALPTSIYSAYAAELSTDGEVFPLHVGDTWKQPAVGCRMEDISAAQHPEVNRYAPPRGLPVLLEAIAARVEARTCVPTTPDEVLVGAGATGVLGGVVGALVHPGDRVILPTPYWPLISGLVRLFGGVPVQAPLVGVATDPQSCVEILEAQRAPGTVATYLNSPNNPTGQVLPESWIAAVVDWARRHDLWIISDEVYEDYVYQGVHTPVRVLAPERTLSLHSFSKAYGMAGYRCGYVVAPPRLVEPIRKVTTHTFYSTPTAAQFAAARALGDTGDRWVAITRAQYREVGMRAAERLGIPSPQGSAFLFLDVAEHLDERGLLGFLKDCARRGLLLAPGPSFGPYPTHLRLCFTSARPEVVERGVEVLATMLRAPRPAADHCGSAG